MAGCFTGLGSKQECAHTHTHASEAKFTVNTVVRGDVRSEVNQQEEMLSHHIIYSLLSTTSKHRLGIKQSLPHFKGKGKTTENSQFKTLALHFTRICTHKIVTLHQLDVFILA